MVREQEQRRRLDDPLLLQIFVCLAVVDISLVVFQLFHCLLLEDLVATFLLELLCECKGVLYSGNFMEVLGVRKTQGAHAEGVSGLLEMTIEVFP